MLRVNVIADAKAAKAYFAAADYFAAEQEHPARWHGKGAELLGLSGPVDFRDFEALCDNTHPRTGGQLSARAKPGRRVGYDWTFSVPKSVSLAFSVGGDDRIAGEFRAAVADTMAEVERDMLTRNQKEGRQGPDALVKSGNLLWADFQHTTSRPINGQPDPQLHLHAVVFNLTHDTHPRQWKAGEFGPLKADAPYYQAAFRAHLANRLQGLGYELRITKGDFEITGVPDRTLKEFSRRTKQIEQTAEDLGITRPETKAKLGATTRQKKESGKSWDDLLRLWTARLKPGELDAIRQTTRDAMQGPLAMDDRSKEAVAYALDHLLERKSVVSERAVATEALKVGIGSVTPESVWKELHARTDLIRDKGLVSTTEVLSEEQRVLKFAKEGRGKFRPLSREAIPASPPARSDPATQPLAAQAKGKKATARAVHPASVGKVEPPLSPGQEKVARHVLTSPDRLILVRGAAGTGKTFLTKRILARVKTPWVILAPTITASRGVLREDGFKDANTLAAFLKSRDMQEQARGGLIWLDEAGMASGRDVARLVDLASQLNSRIVLSGDRRQHKSVARGDVLTMLERDAGLPVAELSEIKRQKGDYKKVAELLNTGRMPEAFERLEAMGWVKELPFPTAPDAGRYGELVDDYVSALQAKKTALIVAPTHKEGDAVTAAVRDRFKTGGAWRKAKDGVMEEVPVLSDERTVRWLRPLNLTRPELELAKKNPEEGVLYTRYGAYREETQQLAVGDQLRATAGFQDAAGRDVDSGTRLTLTGWTEAGNLKVKTASGAERVLGKDVGHVTAGYVSTSQAGQGRTVDEVFLWAPSSTFGAARMDTAYTTGTRGREKLTVYTDSRDGLLEAVQREDRRMLASDLVRRNNHKRYLTWLRSLARRVTKQHEKERAHVVER